jgi:hypothetical protein
VYCCPHPAMLGIMKTSSARAAMILVNLFFILCFFWINYLIITCLYSNWRVFAPFLALQNYNIFLTYTIIN